MMVKCFKREFLTKILIISNSMTFFVDSPEERQQIVIPKLTKMKKAITRRKFVKTTLAGTAAISMLPAAGCITAPGPFDPKGLPTRVLGTTGVRVPLLGFGCGSRWMAIEDDDRALGILEHALNSGMYYWDTAASYANEQISSEERIGKILSTRRKEVFQVTKLDERDGEKAKETIERSLQRLGTDYIDLLHVHSINSVEDAEQLGEKGKVLEVMHDYRDQGIIRHIGFTGHTTAEGMKRAAELYDFEVMMIALNHNVPGGAEQFEEHAVPYAAKKGMGVVAMKVIRPRETVVGLSAEMLLRYALSLDYFALANIGTDSMEVLRANLELIRDFKPLDSDEMEDIRIALEPFLQHKNLAWMDPSYLDGWPGSGTNA
jgi:predicted aldo/keto reductase-like oxidoreductase